MENGTNAHIQNTRAKKKALLLGATGVVGRQLLKLLLADETYEQVTVFIRSEFLFNHPKLYIVPVNYEELAGNSNYFKVDDIFCTLGTTIQKAGTLSGFRRCDFHYVTQAAKMAKENLAKQFLVISAVGADPFSPFFYLKIKGEMEREVVAEGPPRIAIVRPSLLVASRHERGERRRAEELMIQLLSPVKRFFIFGLKKYAPVTPEEVAHLLHQLAHSTNVKTNIEHFTIYQNEGSYGQASV